MIQKFKPRYQFDRELKVIKKGSSGEKKILEAVVRRSSLK